MTDRPPPTKYHEAEATTSTVKISRMMLERDVPAPLV